MNDKRIEVFQDLHLTPGDKPVESIREHVLAQVALPWRHEAAREQEIRNAAGTGDLIALSRAAPDDVGDASLVLWQKSGGYHVSNIVPKKDGQLSIGQYNAILQDFASAVGQPAATAGGFSIEATKALQAPEDWFEPEAAAALRRFCNLANKSISHPKDQDRWMEFLILVHRSSSRAYSDLLARWLCEADGWPDDGARSLARQFEFAESLLQKYDSTAR